MGIEIGFVIGDLLLDLQSGFVIGICNQRIRFVIMWMDGSMSDLEGWRGC
jgi:hypothetical protein